MPSVHGVDGCRRGWVSLGLDLGSGELSWSVLHSFGQLFSNDDLPTLVAVDIPIGLTVAGPRVCDCEVRRLLGRPRRSSVFPAPIRAVLDAEDYAEASARRRSVEGKGLSRQTWAIVPKIREVDTFLRSDPAVRSRVREIHPELCFWALAHQQPTKHRKKTREGIEERRRLLEPHFGRWVADALDGLRGTGCSPDDVLDAFAALWTARRVVEGTARTFPSAPPRDPFGLPMEMVT